MKRHISYFFLLVTLVACAHEDLGAMYAAWNKSLEGRQFHKFDFARNTPKTKQMLSNGNIEYQYNHGLRECIDVLEVNPRTDIIVKASFIEGLKKDCKWYP